MLSSWSGTSNRRITVACFSVGFGPTGLLPCTFIIYADPGEDKRSVRERKSYKTQTNLEGSEAVGF